MKKFMALLMAAVMCASVLTACGNDSAASESTAASESATESTAVESTAVESTAVESTAVESTEDADVAEESTEAVSTEKDVLVFGTNAEFPPFEYLGDDGEPDGFDIALIKAIGEKMGVEVEIQNMEFASLVAATGTKIDGVIAGLTVTDERKEAVDFSDAYYEAVQYVIVPTDSSIATADDLKNKTIGVQLGTTGMFIAEEIEGATVQSYNKAVDAVNDLNNGRVDLVIIDRNPAEVFVSKFPDKIVAMEGAQFGFEAEEYAIALPKGSDLVEQVNTALAELKADGTFDALVAQYIGEAE